MKKVKEVDESLFEEIKIGDNRAEPVRDGTVDIEKYKNQNIRILCE